MGSSSYSSTDYTSAVKGLKATGATFARSARAAATGNVHDIAENLNPRKLKNNIREACFAAGFEDVTPIVISIDGTGSMQDVPHQLQEQLPNLIDLLTTQGISDHPNVLFLMHDDETVIPPDAAFQMSQFEAGHKELLEALNEVVIPGQGGGNDGEAYHLSLYAVANHTKLECFERDGTKGFFFLIGDEQPFYDRGDPKKRGTSPEIAKELFGDVIQSEVSMLESLKKVLEKYHFFVIRPGHTSHGQDASITRMWQDLIRAAGGNPQHVLEVTETEAIVSTMSLAIGRVVGADNDDLVDVLRKKKAAGVDGAIAATTAIVPVGDLAPAVAKTSTALETADSHHSGRTRR